MAYITVTQAIDRSRSSGFTGKIAESEIRKSASSSIESKFDVFLSHSYQDAEVIAGVKEFIEDQNLRVYVDWIEDPQADRRRVTPATADMLRRRMRNCRFLLYASSEAAQSSRWMPWELGFFDGIRPGHIGILPIVNYAGARFNGQEYLGLYPYYELFTVAGVPGRLALDIDGRTAMTLSEAVR